MSQSKFFITVLVLVAAISLNSYAHCDSYNGPVIKAAEQALKTGNVNYVLIWVQKDDEPVIKTMFDKVIKVRGLNNDTKELADNYFFETLVRIHRQGEGVAYTGIKAADYKPGEGIEAADVSIENNSIEKVLAFTNEKDHAEVKELFKNLQNKRNYKTDDVEKGREYVAAYVHFIHYIEGLYGGESSEHHHH